jgi:hypothetical protein
VAEEIVQSSEHRGLEVDFYFQTLLHRTEAPSERTAWITNFANGATEADIVEDFMNSSEYQTAHASDASFAAALYTDILGRTGSSTDIMAVETELANHTFTRAQLIHGYVHSDEAYRDAVSSFFAAFLHRDVSQDPGLATWMNKLKSGESLGQVEAEILADPGAEFYNDGAATVH